MSSAPFEGAFAEAPGAFGGDDGDLAVGLQFAGVYILFDGIVLLFYRTSYHIIKNT